MFATDHVAYASSNKTKIVGIKTELFSFFFFTQGGCISCLRACLGARLLPQSYQYPNFSEGDDRVGGQLRGDKECPFSGVTKSGRVWRKVKESAPRSVRPGLSVLTSLLVSVDVKLYIEPCFGIGLSLSLICQLTSEDIKQHNRTEPQSYRYPNLSEGADRVCRCGLAVRR